MRRAVRCAVALAVVVTAVLARGAVEAHADEFGGSDQSSGSIAAGVQIYSGGWRGTGTSCTWKQMTASAALDRFDRDLPIEKVVNGVRFRLYERTCGSRVTLVWIARRAPRALGGDGRAYLSRILPAPVIATAPPAAHGVVQDDMWFWTPTAWQPMSVTAWIPGPMGPVWATTTATPARLVIDPGDRGLGTGPLVCPGPGQPWAPELGDAAVSECAYAYPHSSVLAPGGHAFTARMSIEWDVSWTSSSGAGGALAPLRTAATTGVTVGEIQAVVISP
jgi:hypothetical protein